MRLAGCSMLTMSLVASVKMTSINLNLNLKTNLTYIFFTALWLARPAARTVADAARRARTMVSSASFSTEWCTFRPTRTRLGLNWFPDLQRQSHM